MQVRRRGLIALLGLMMILVTGRVCAQENATVTGNIVDASGAAIPNVKVTITNKATSQSRTT